MTYTCPVCGYAGLPAPPYLASGKPSYEFCESCDYQFGYTDGSEKISFGEWRQMWIDAGMPWDWGHSDDGRPAGWNPVEQLKNLRLR